jgi:large subunit ribosomal protein L9
VKDGYGRNFLVPRGSAILWTKGAETQIASIKRVREVREVKDLGHAQEVKAQLEGLKVWLSARAGESGRLFGAVTVADVAEAVKAAGGPEVDRRTITLVEPIKTIGAHAVTVRIHPDVVATVNVEVTTA